MPKQLLEKDLSVQDSMKIFGLSDQIPEKAELNKLYKNLVRANHPDLGGSTETMAMINSAMDTLEKYAGETFVNNGKSNSTYDQKSYEQRKRENEERNKAFFDAMDILFRDSFDPEELLGYLSNFTSEELFIDVEYPTLKRFNLMGSAYYSVPVEVYTQGRNLVFYVEYYISPSVSANMGSLGSDSVDPFDTIYNVSIKTNILYDNRKYKIGQNNWLWGVGKKSIVDYSLIFPEKNVLKILSVQSENKRIFKKRDMELGLERLLPAVNFDKDIYYIYPFGKSEKFYISIQRLVQMKLATYYLRNIQAINPETKKYFFPSPSIGKIRGFPEKEETLVMIVDLINRLIEYKEKNNLNPVNDSLDLIDEAQALYSEIFTENAYEKMWKD